MNRINKTEIEGLYLIDTFSFSDNRGKLIKPFTNLFFDNHSLNLSFKETWFTQSHKNVIRAMHMQVGPKGCEKLISVIKGSVFDVIIDLRKDSPTFLKTQSFLLSSSKPHALYIPQNCGHGYKVLEDDTITMYMATNTHDDKNDVGILWDSFGFDWKINNPILSDRDLQLPTLEDYLKK
jgi:dTDP-4-dehydrorhamnose 3,5-epimerase